MDNGTTGEYIVTARKWRPLQFKDVIGQEHITRTLQNAIRTNRHHHAFLFSGPRGVGKTTTARILARALNCSDLQDAEPCNKCDSCIGVLEGRSMDIIEIDGASNNSVDDIRKLRENSRFSPVSGKYKMYIIDEVHMLSTSAFNALLKTLEEPPAHLIFVFATTEAHKVPATILSRCQRFDFRRLPVEKIASQLKYIAQKEKIEIDEDSLVALSRKADGSMRDGQSIFDQVVAFCGNNITYLKMADALHLIDQDFFFKISDAVKEKNIPGMFELANEVNSKGYDLQECMGGLLEHFRNMLTAKVGLDKSYIESSPSFIQKYLDESKNFIKADILRYLSLISTAEQALRYAPQPKIKFELTLVQLASMDSAVEISTLLDEIKAINSGSESPRAFVSESNSNAYTSSPKTKPSPIDVSLHDEYIPTEAPKKSVVEKLVEKSTEAVKTINIHKPENITKEMLSEGWQEFISKYATGESGLLTISQSEFVQPKFFNGEVVLQVNNKFFADKLNDNKSLFHDLLLEHFGSEIGVKIMVDDSPANPTAHEKQNSSSKISSEKDNTDSKNKNSHKENKPHSSSEKLKQDSNMENKHPVEKAIIEILGAKEINNNI